MGLKYGFPDEKEIEELHLSPNEHEVILWLKDDM